MVSQVKPMNVGKIKRRNLLERKNVRVSVSLIKSIHVLRNDQNEKQVLEKYSDLFHGFYKVQDLPGPPSDHVETS